MAARILIAGAGIGGLTTALCLAKAGHQVTILERRTHLDAAGAGIQISPNASRVLVDLGLGAALERLSVAARALIIRSYGSGAVVARAPLDSLSRRNAAPYWLLRRADLQSVLLDAAVAHPSITIAYSETVEAAEQFDNGVLVEHTASDGPLKRTSADLVIGADGLWSSLARPGDGKHAAPSFTGYEAWRTSLPVEQVPEPLRGPDVGLWLGPDTHVVHYLVASGRAMNIVLVRGNASSETGWTRSGDAASIEGLIATSAPDLSRMLKPIDDWQVWSLFDAPVRPMARGRVALVGDAAHPVLPFLAQGGALAIEDAAALAARLPPAVFASDTSLRRALLVFDRDRRARAAKVQQAARANGRAYHLGWPASLIRDQAMALLGGDRLLQRYDWLYGWQHPQFSDKHPE